MLCRKLATWEYDDGVAEGYDVKYGLLSYGYFLKLLVSAIGFGCKSDLNLKMSLNASLVSCVINFFLLFGI